VCASATGYNPNQSTGLASQIQMYNFKSAYILELYTSVGVLVGSIMLFGVMVCCPGLVYGFILVTFAILLGFSFYLLKAIQLRVSENNIPNGTIFYTDETRMNSLAYVFLGFYLILFPLILFAPKKIGIGVKILSKMRPYF
jgi:hypothetical protein